MNDQNQQRKQYTVTMRVHPVSRVVGYTKWAESPEHAIRKAKESLGEGYVVEEATAEAVG